MLQVSKAANSVAHVKGAALLPLLDWYARRYGQERLLAALRGASLALIDTREPQFGILTSGWYEAGPVHALLESLCSSFTPAERADFLREGGRAIIEATLTGVYRWLFQAMMTPERYARNADRLFGRFYDSGVLRKEILGPRHHRTHLTEWRAHHRIICEFFPSTLEYIYSSMGCQGVCVRRSACIDDGAAECTLEVTWES
jgi:hypothetical protein